MLNKAIFRQLTPLAARIIFCAGEESRALGHGYIGTEHLVLGMLHNTGDVAFQILGSSFGLTLEHIREQIEKFMPRGKSGSSGNIPFTPRAKEAFELALRRAQVDSQMIGTGHVLLGILDLPLTGPNSSAAAKVLKALGVDLEQLKSDTTQLTSGG